jgi:formylglycine-generating enzyme required for sulfatase activity
MQSTKSSIRHFAIFLAFISLAGLMSVSRAANITIDTVPIGNAGNAPDQLWPQQNPANVQFGSVSYAYNIGRTEVTNAQYAAFLNAKAESDPLGLYNFSMGSSNKFGGITRSGISGSYTYATKSNMADKPVNFVSWYDAIRFVNWLNNGQGTGDTETGAYTILGGTATPSNGMSITRNSGATWWLPSEDEWYKAAYYDPRTTAEGGPPGDSHYWLYPTASNSAPTLATANSVGDISNPGANVANYGQGAAWNGVLGNLTTVGSAGSLSQSFYRTSDQGGNVNEWNESVISDTYRGIRGSSFMESASRMQPSERLKFPPADYEPAIVGFRVATVPEPSSVVLAIVGSTSLIFAARHRRRMLT